MELGPIPDNGVLVENEYTAVSIGTELYGWLHGTEPGQKPMFPRTTGYCNAGIVREVGQDVTHVKPGDRVTGMGNHASHNILTSNCHNVPQNVTMKAAALVTMAAVAQHGNRVAKIEFGESVVIMGLGLVGQLALSLARLSGGRPVIAVDLDNFRLDIAKARGADVCINPKDTADVPQAVRDSCIDNGANVVIECTGKPSVYPVAVKMASMGGRLIALGSPRGTVKMDFFSDIHLREVNIFGALQPITPEHDHIYFRWTKQRERTLLMQLMGEGELPVEDLITHVAKPNECQEVYTMLDHKPDRVLGILFDWKNER